MLKSCLQLEHSSVKLNVLVGKIINGGGGCQGVTTFLCLPAYLPSTVCCVVLCSYIRYQVVLYSIFFEVHTYRGLVDTE